MAIDRKQVVVRASLAAAHVGLLLAAYVFSIWQSRDLSARNIFRIVLFSEAGLLAVWAALSGTTWQRRTVITLAGWFLCWILLARRHPRESAYWLGVYLLLPNFASLLLALAMQSAQHRRAVRQGGHPGAPWQFTTRDLLAFTAVVGISIVLVQWFRASRLANETTFLFSEGSQLSILLVLGISMTPRFEGSRRKIAARKFARLVCAAVAAVGLGLVMQSFWSHSWFWDVLRNLRATPAAALWEDLLSIPTAVLFESLFAVLTVCLWRGGDVEMEGEIEKS